MQFLVYLNIPSNYLTKTNDHINIIYIIVIKVNFTGDFSKRSKPSMHTTTTWKLEPSFVFDLLCCLNILSGDDFYVRYYREEYEHFRRQFTPEVNTTLKRLKAKMKDEGKQIISAMLCLYFSATDAHTLADLLSTVEDSSTMQATLKQSPYYNEEEWHLYETVRPDLTTIFRFLQDIGFDDYWQSTLFPQITERIRSLQTELAPFNIVVEDETLLGRALPSNEITIYVLSYAQPHGIKVLGTRFITDISYPLRIVVSNAGHEMLHPPFDDKHEEVKASIALLQEDSFLMETFVGHNPDFAYNTFAGMIEEGCVRALDQLINEKLGIADDPRERWRTEDGGMHVFAACLYAVLDEEHYNEREELFAEFLVRQVRTKLKPGSLKQIYDAFMQG
jgi:hypothetical protein